MTTSSDIIQLALKDAGIIGESQTASSDTFNDSLNTLNSMLALWNVQNLISYADIGVNVTLTGADSYAISLNNDAIDVYYYIGTTPILLNRKTNSEFNSKIRIGGTPLDYNQEINSSGSTLMLNPNPTSGTLKIIGRNEIPTLALTDTIALPASYILPIRLNLAVLLCTTFGLTPPDILIIQANNTLNTLKSINSRIPQLKVQNTGRYNILTNRNS